MVPSGSDRSVIVRAEVAGRSFRLLLSGVEPQLSEVIQGLPALAAAATDEESFLTALGVSIASTGVYVADTFDLLRPTAPAVAADALARLIHRIAHDADVERAWRKTYALLTDASRDELLQLASSPDGEFVRDYVNSLLDCLDEQGAKEYLRLSSALPQGLVGSFASPRL